MSSRLLAFITMVFLPAMQCNAILRASAGGGGRNRWNAPAFQSMLYRRGSSRPLVVAPRKGKKDNTDPSDPANMYRDTVALPQTGFDQRANAPVREPQIQKFWEDKRIYQSLYEKPSGK